MIHFLTWLAFGDCLITGSLLEQADDFDAQAKVVGTEITAEVFSLLRRPPRVAAKVFDGVPAFYAARSHSFRDSLRDLSKARAWLATNLARGDVAVFENAASLRNMVMCQRAACQRVEIPRERGAYLDRHARYSVLLPNLQPFAEAAVPDRPARRLLVNPCARSADRQLPLAMVRTLVRRAAARGIETVLLDMNGQFESLGAEVTRYARQPPLAESAAMLRAADRYVGPDSFFVHLAYYYRVPSLSVFHRENVYFMPPGTAERRSFLFFDELRDDRAVERRIDAFL